MEKKKKNTSEKLEEENKEKKLILKKTKTATISTLVSFVIGIISSIIPSITLFKELFTKSDKSRIILIAVIFLVALTMIYSISKYLLKNKPKSRILTLKESLVKTYIDAIDNCKYNPKFSDVFK